MIWDGFGKKVSCWSYMDESSLRAFLLDRIAEGFSFPINPKWALCDPGWYEVYTKLAESKAAAAAMDMWLPKALRGRIEEIHKDHPHGFQCNVSMPSEQQSSAAGAPVEANGAGSGSSGAAASSAAGGAGAGRGAGGGSIIRARRSSLAATDAHTVMKVANLEQDSLDHDLAGLHLARHEALQRARKRLRVVTKWLLRAAEAEKKRKRRRKLKGSMLVVRSMSGRSSSGGTNSPFGAAPKKE